MFESSIELAENKLLLLYILNKIDKPLTNTLLTELVLENSFMNYFTLQQYISELADSKFIQYIPVNEKQHIIITEKGNNVLSFFKDRVSESKINIVDEYIKTKIDIIKKELTLHSDYTLGPDDNFIVELKATENDSLLMDLKLSVPTKKQAISICNKWNENPSNIYTQILSTLIEE